MPKPEATKSPPRTPTMLPTVADQQALPLMAEPPAETPDTPTAPTTSAAPPVRLDRRTIEVPQLPLPPMVYVRCRVDSTLTRQQGEALRRLELGLAASGAVLRDGRQVANAQDALRWLLEQLG